VENDKKKTKNNKETAEAVSTLHLAYEFPQTKTQGQPMLPPRL
jgi:hypothetical protein